MTNLPVPAHDQEHLEAVRYAESNRFVPAIVGLIRRDLNPTVKKTHSQVIRGFLRSNAYTLSRDLIDALAEAATVLAEHEQDPRPVGCVGERYGANHVVTRMVRR